MWKPSSSSPASTGNETKPQHSASGGAVVTAAPTPSVARPAAFAPTPAPVQNEQGIIGKSLIIKGEVTGSESVFVDGRVEGTINLPENRVTIGRNGVVEADVNAKEVVVQGKLHGNVTAGELVEIRNGGTVVGDVSTVRISVEDGAFIKGGIEIRREAK
jgi:cytoskeletal protein CcmA (bactofilin family)